MKLYDWLSLKRVCKDYGIMAFYHRLVALGETDDEIVCAVIDFDDDDKVSEIYVYTHEMIFTVEKVVFEGKKLNVFVSVPRVP